MTNTATRPNWALALEMMGRFWRQVLDVCARALLGAGIVLAAGVVAVAAAVVALIIAVGAVLLRFVGQSRRHSSQDNPDFDGVTLEARRTPRGWTVE